MWATLIFCGTTALFLSMTLAALWHLRWVRRFPALEALTTATGPALSSPSERVRCSVVIAARDEETRILGLMAGTAAGLTTALSPLTLIMPASILARRLGWPWPCAVFVPFMVPAFLYALVNSTWVTLRQGGIRWRDTFYALDALRSAPVR